MIAATTAALAVDPPLAAALFAGGVFASAMLTDRARRYALRRKLLDPPGPRRSHAMPTPRGGGVAPALVLLVGGALLLAFEPASGPGLGICLLGLTAVAGIGWLDDHRPLPAWLRLFMHVGAGMAASLALVGVPRTPEQLAMIALDAVVVAGFVNSWNFMDGIDGLAASQAGLVAIVLLIGAGSAGNWLDGAWGGFGWLLLAAVLGFLPFNFPRARIFLGDVGSGALGFAVACLLLRAVSAGTMTWMQAALLPSAFLLDSGLTLATRIARRRPWWKPHREHLYQWLVRTNRSHARVTSAYAIWTIAAGGSAIVLARGGHSGAWFGGGALLFGCLSWTGLRKRVWMTARHRP
jgi:UDP-N-acetylmuramyl pentapeptide phosphotransferase/UDP-N-acetylglucosamine-1-phosphate transferase